MKRILRGCCAIFLAICLLSGMLPGAAAASDNELVLTRIGHTSSDTISLTNGSARAVTLTVPFSYPANTLDLSTGLIIEKAPSIESVVTSFGAGSAAPIGDVGTAGPPVVMTVTYYKGGAAVQYATAYTIRVMRAQRKAPLFSGTITKAVTAVTPGSKISDIVFSAGDFTNLYTANDGGALTNISIAGSSLSCGSLKIATDSSYANYIPGTLISIGDIGKLVFDATGGGTVSYIVSAYGGNDTANAVGAVLLTITVTELTAPSIRDSIIKSVSAGAACTFTMNDFSGVLNLHGGTADTIEITPAGTSCGVWYNGAASFTGTAAFTPATIGNLKFIGSAAGTAAFSWRVSNEAGFSAPGSGAVNIKAASAPVITSSVVKAVNLGSTLTFSPSDFTSCCSLNNGTLTSIVLTPVKTGCGTWYKGSTAFTGSKAFDANEIKSLKFKGTVCGQAAFTWTVSNEKGTSAAGNGTVTVNPVSTTISCTTALNTPKTFNGADFNAACKDATGAGLQSICFTLPPASCGTLWNDYSSPLNPGSAVTTNTALYYSKHPKISSVTFVPASNYTGTFTFAYTCVNTNGVSYTGSIKMIVGSAGDVSYFTTLNTAKTFNPSDFNAACADVTGAGLSYVYFTLPSAASGALFYGYASPSGPGTPVSPNSPYSLQNLAYVTFVPSASFTGTLSIQYTGVSVGSVSYTGYVKITVGSSGAVTYSVTKNTAKMFSALDFSNACAGATGAALSYITVTPPSAVYGTLYYSDASASNPGTAVTAGMNFFTNGTPSISSMTFVPAANITGSVTIAYTGVSVNGAVYSGTIILNIDGAVSDISYTAKADTAAAFKASDFSAVSLGITGSRLAYVTFSPPAASYGKLYYNNASASYSGSAVTADTAYYPDFSPYIDGIAFVPAPHYSGTVPITYTGYCANGASYTGRVIIQVKSKNCSSYFTDVGPLYAWAFSAVDFLFESGVVKGTGSSQYSPGVTMTRGDFLLMLYRAMGYSGSMKNNFSDVPKGSYYYDAIAVAKDLGIAKGNKNKFSPNSPLTRQDAMVFIYRALLVTGANLTAGSKNDIAGFSDKGSISGYALTAVETLVKAGLIKGIGNKLNPGSVLTRAEMAVVLYRVKMTY